ncbi:phenylacetic acid degradation bifunctional protein PaaZ [Sphingomonas japonica]|uniref:Oxepin-CoA hydrolase/3-oxo-5,6-dehydrosuberyl-CoA semialdehyde dehydrogenase n=1 Tax=Sphingomonas japonica TaxID=511662 RepID=A0ABX0TWL0_9SPHN|nr:phenylacetic acid degradation bifunctional protein PaaZ [Sphingomonas japonica]NIJ22700.1 oxepin-CoA hydrolase/3-oxo-5,6-dehydrosuberyl-CoA semialdehyde dehydrogenase [Sphingomonas japonica]
MQPQPISIVKSFAEGRWHTPAANLQSVASALTGAVVAQTSSDGLDFGAMVSFARRVGGPALRAMTFRERAAMLKALAQAVMARKEELYALAVATGATRSDNAIDIEGGAGTLFSYASKGRRELPDDQLWIDGEPEPLGRGGSFVGQHVLSPRHGVAVHINAFNFPVWGMLEKLGPTWLAGMPAIVKPAQATGYVSEACVQLLLDTGLLPEGALQLVSGSAGDLLDHLGGQDVVAFTGSAATAQKLQNHSVIAREAVRFTAERDSLNASILGPDAEPGSPEFDLFVREVVREMTVKAGQKCTAIRRALVPSSLIDDVQDAVSARLAKIVVGDPAVEGVRMGALVSRAQRDDVRARVTELAAEARLVHGSLSDVALTGDGLESGAFLSPLLLRADDPGSASLIHEVEAFGPVATLMPYRDLDDAVMLANRGKGSLVMSVFTHDAAVARDVTLGAGAFHGRILLADRDSAGESTGHGSPLPVLVHGGPGRAGGGEELGGLRGVKHYMQRTALQGSPALLSKVVRQQLPGAPIVEGDRHPFRLTFTEIEPGYSVRTAPRTVTLADIEQFAHFTGDTFYAHMDEEAATANPLFGGRVAHGYLILAFAAGLFVDPAPGPVLANYGLENLRFVQPLKPGEAMQAVLTCKSKVLKTDEMGEVRWNVRVTNQDGDLVATYDLLTMNALV